MYFLTSFLHTSSHILWSVVSVLVHSNVLKQIKVKSVTNFVALLVDFPSRLALAWVQTVALAVATRYNFYPVEVKTIIIVPSPKNQKQELHYRH